MSIRRAAQPPGGRSEVCPADLREPSAKQDGWPRAVESRVRDEKWRNLSPNWILDFRGVCYHCSQMRPSGRIELSTKQIPEARTILSSRTWLKTEHCPREISADVDLEDCLFLLKHRKKELSKYCLRPGYIFRWLKRFEKWGLGRCMGVCVCVHTCMHAGSYN